MDRAFVRGPIVRFESRVAPRILTLSDSRIAEPAILTELKLENGLSLCDVPNKIATDLVGFGAMPFLQNQM